MNVGYSNLKSIPESIGELVDMEMLILKGCKIEQFPQTISFLQKLKHLDFSLCKFSTFPIEILKLKNLEVLIINGNRFNTLPDLSGFKKLRKLIIDKNKYDIKKLKLQLPNCEII